MMDRLDLISFYGINLVRPGLIRFSLVFIGMLASRETEDGKALPLKGVMY